MDRTFFICSAIAALIIIRSGQRAAQMEQQEDFIDAAQTTLDEVMDTITETISGPGPIANMQTSYAMLAMLRSRERLVLTPYNLGDGGWTVGYGHFERTRDALPIIRNQADAEAVFADDVVHRAEKWVKLYVKIDLTQNQFDGLVSIAFNMSPQSFKKFADTVNRGEGIDAMAERSIAWVPAHLQNGIRNRRNHEMDVFNNGVYA